MAEEQVETLDIYEDEDGNEFVLVDGEFVPFIESEYNVVFSEEQDARWQEADSEEVFEVFEDEDGSEYILVDGEKVPYVEDEFEVVAPSASMHTTSSNPDDPDFNPLAYENVQAATDVANDFVRTGASIAREGAALAGELKEAMDDITSMLDVKTWLK